MAAENENNDSSPSLETMNQMFQQMMNVMTQQQQMQTQLLQAMATANQTPGTGAPEPEGQNRCAKVPEPNRPPLLEANVNLEEFDIWRAVWRDYAVCYRFESLPLDQQLARLRTFFSVDMRSELLHGIGIDDLCADLQPEQVLDRIREYLRARKNVAVDRVAFEERKQKDGETFDDYLIDLKKIAKHADLCTSCYDDRVTTRIMVGINDVETKRRLLAIKPFPDLQKVVDFCRSEESGKLNEATLRGSNPDAVQIDKVATRVRPPAHNPPPGPNPLPRSGGTREYPPPNDAKCNYCGFPGHPRSKCPASQQTCNNCGISGHFARVCRKPKPPQRTGERQITSINIQSASTGESTSPSKKAPQISVSVYDRADKLVGFCRATPDSAAEATVAGREAMRRLNILPENLCPATESLVAANGKQIYCFGTAKLSFKYGDRVSSATVYFCDSPSDILLSWFLSQKLGILPRNYPSPCFALQKSDKCSDVETIRCQIAPTSANPSEQDVKQVRAQLMNIFADVFDDSETLKPMSAPPMRIELKDGAVPFSLRTARNIPFAWKEKVHEELEKLMKQGVIEPVPDSDGSEWCHPLVCVPKKGTTEPRVCVDLTKLNTHVIRPVHPFPSPKTAVSSIPNGCQYFSLMDARKGYFQMDLHPESRPLTTFLTPWGRFRFLRAPMGLCSTGDEFCKHGDRAFQGIANLQKVVDDTIVYDEDFSDHLDRVIRILLRCREFSITLSPHKFKFAQSGVNFCGYDVHRDGITADGSKIAAIKDFPTPCDISELRSFFGIVNQLGEFSNQISHIAEPLRSLLSPKTVFRWLPEHQRAFEDVKKAIVQPPTLAAFDINLPTRLYTDASRKKGLGFALLQEHPGKIWKLVECGSRFLTDTETRYATIELEMLALVWSTEKCRLYLQGLTEYEVILDHKPLIPILNDKTCDMIENPRLQRLKLRISGYIFKAKWIKGTENALADALSRAPVQKRESEDNEQELNQVSCSVLFVNAVMNPSELHQAIRSDDILSIAELDENYLGLRESVKAGFQNFDTQNPYLSTFSKMRDDLSVEGGLVLLGGTRIVIPKAMKHEILDRLHSSHQGIEKTKQRARSCVFWPGINSDITNTVKACAKCQEMLPSNTKEPLLSDPQPEWVFQDVAADMFSYANRSFLVYVDRLSGWPMIYDYGKTTPSSRQVIRTFRQFFGDLGVPSKLRTYNGPQFSSKEFQTFLREWGVQSALSSPHYPQANGLAESAVKAMKHLVRKTTSNGDLNTDEFLRGILEYRNTPRFDGFSPAQILYGHPLNSHMPAHRNLFKTHWKNIEELIDHRMSVLAPRADYYNSTAHELPLIRIGQRVRIQDPVSKRWDKVADVVASHGPRSYLLKLPSGRVYWRNRRYLRVIPNGRTSEDEPFSDSEEPAPLRRSNRARQHPDRYEA